jgi:hypothetical protein
MHTRKRRYPIDEIARRGTEIYETKIRSSVEAANMGRILAVDVDSGDYAIADENLDACQSLIAKNPDAQIWSLRIGHIAVEKIGGGDTRVKS